MNNIRFWTLISELNTLTTILSVRCPEYAERVNSLKSELTEIIKRNLELSEKITKLEVDSWYVRNN